VPAEIKPKRVPAKEREVERNPPQFSLFRKPYIEREREREGAYV
jgi:hypothetical protein